MYEDLSRKKKKSLFHHKLSLGQFQSTCPSDKDNFNDSKCIKYISHVNSRSITESSFQVSSSDSFYNSLNEKRRSSMISVMKSIPRLSTFSNSNANTMSNFSMFKTKAKSLKKRKQKVNLKLTRNKGIIQLNNKTSLNENKRVRLSVSGNYSIQLNQSKDSKHYSNASSMIYFNQNFNMFSEEDITNRMKLKNKQKTEIFLNDNSNNIKMINMNNIKLSLLQSSIEYIAQNVSSVLQYQDLSLPVIEEVTKKEEHTLFNSQYLNKAISKVRQETIISMNYFDRLFKSYFISIMDNNHLLGGMCNLLLNKYYDSCTFYYLLQNFHFLSYKDDSLFVLSHQYSLTETKTKVYMMLKLIQKDVPIDHKQIVFNKEQFFEKYRPFLKDFNEYCNKRTFSKKSSFLSLNKLYTKKKTTLNERANYLKAKTAIDKIGCLNRNYFDRGSFKVSDMNNIVNEIKMHPKRQVEHIHFHICDQQAEMQRTKDMSKESLVYRTQEIKLKMKKDLQNIEEILFFLIKENNFREFKDISDKYRVNTESRDKDGNTFLIFAVECGFIDFVKWLVQKGANIDAQNLKGNTALHLAMIFQNFDIIDYLLRNGANERLLNDQNLTPWECLQLYSINKVN